jgi:hypothetical protein
MSARLQTLLAVAAIGVFGLTGCSQMRPRCGDGCRCGSPYAGMTYDVCCETCGPNCGPSCGSCAACGQEAGCGSPGDGCNSCKKGNRVCPILGAFQCNGCGELYWSEWFNDPPRCCDPCDCYGNYLGCNNPGHYRAPYLMHGGHGDEGPTALPPLEVAPPEKPASSHVDAQSLPEAPMPDPLPGAAESLSGQMK